MPGTITHAGHPAVKKKDKDPALVWFELSF